LATSLALCVATAACTPREATNAAAESAPLAADTSWGTFHVTVSPQPNPIPSNKMFALAIAVSPADNHGQAAADTTVAVDARMPAHNHGMNLRPRVTRDGDGRFRADGLLFHMPGTWELYVDVARATEMERATFVIHVD
jgi:hypothetical protein